MSENYRSLTRTYRPRTFDDIVSQQHVSSTLKNAIQKNRLAHAYMFCGPRGVGKTTMARVLARTVNSIDKEVDGESLNQTLNVIEIDAASNNKVDDIRDLREKVRVPPQNGRYKIYIIDEVHMLSKSAFNALLKTLEEPPDHVIFIFATTEPHKVLPTILSRVQRFDFKRISIDEIVDRLNNVAEDQGIRIDEESLHVIAKKADGALRDALGLMDQAIAFCGSDIQHEELLRALNVVSTERMFDFMEAVKTKNAEKGLNLINELLQEGYDIQEYLVGLTEHLRNLYVAASSAKMHLVEASPDNKKRYKKSAEDFSEDDLMRMLHIVSEAQYKLKEAQQPKIQFEITLLKLIHMERTENLNKLLKQLEDLKKKSGKRQKLTSSSEENTESNFKTKSTNGRQSEEDIQQKSRESIKQQADTQKDEPAKTENTGKKQVSAESDDKTYDSSSTNGKDNVTDHEETEAGKENEDFTNLFGKSSLGKSPSSSPKATTQTKSKKPQTKTKSPSKAPKDISLEEINSQWEDYLEELRHHVPQMLYFQMQRVDPVELKNGELMLRCNDDFAKKIVAENDRRLSKLLEDEIGAFLSFNCTVRQKDNDTEKSMSPYERFKNLQKRDPKIKKLVELFGAELDYNLNQ
ncbi:DNA polymerase-3 subunit gamma/tau [Fodinibius salinus]|uniref:DNA polymerase III subunit gamma/tau n=1 Tax=Fodinibius salinus TaxID=860790 RepID=A0A5D3YL92_9BACT|nr:DNA polymerase III subunit gamma/tau [Fodinibius salinus]TYP93461.1 DNA polymerase-3 subunit gamma/tau [Fodinibius salinus]